MRDPSDSNALSVTRDVVEGRVPLSPQVVAEFEKLVRQHAARIYNVCYRITRDVETSKDLQQEALLTAYQKLGEFGGRSSLSTWICGIARNLAFNKVRRRDELLSEDGIVDPASTEADVLRALSRAEREQVMREATAMLAPLEQQVVHLRYVENLDRAHVAGTLDLEGGSEEVRAILQTATRHLKKDLKERLARLGHGSSFVRTREWQG